MKLNTKNLIFPILILAAGFALLTLYHHRPFRTRLAAYATDLRQRTEAQEVNIHRVGKQISGKVLHPGESFSLNQQAGPYTEDRGFLPERTYLGDQMVFTPGGGVCQVASTLFNAADLAGLRILERIPHSGTVRSVPPGKDATVAYGVADLKFLNPHPYPVKIVSRFRNEQLIMEIWGKETTHE